jgi:anti-sigma-K factor RskA
VERDLDELRELAAAYVLDALDPETEREFEEAMRRSPELRAEVADLREASVALAYAVPAPEPPAGLRERILEQAVAERPSAVVIPFRRRLALPVLGGLAAAAAAAAIGLGIWSASLSSDLGDREAALEAQAELAALVADPGSRTLPIDAVDGTLVVNGEGEAALFVNGLDPAPDGKEYAVWVIDPGEAPAPAGLFGGGRGSAVAVTEAVRAGATVAVTLEREGGVDAPTTEPLFAATLT